jgi:hypothetical protein
MINYFYLICGDGIEPSLRHDLCVIYKNHTHVVNHVPTQANTPMLSGTIGN